MEIASSALFPSLGKYIYCPNTDGLTDEHTIPLCLGGNQVIVDGSCKECQKATHAIEGHVCGRMFKALRVHHKIPTRRPKDRPTHLVVLDGTSPHDANPRQISVEEAPGVVVFPIFSQPTVIAGGPPRLLSFLSYSTTENARERISKLRTVEGFSNVLTYIDFNPSRFGRVLAKIAHAIAVAVFGNQVQSELAPLILDRHGNPFSHVGCGFPTILPAPTPNTLHQVGTDTVDINGVKYLFVQLRLFGYLGSPHGESSVWPPEYSILVGRFLN